MFEAVQHATAVALTEARDFPREMSAVYERRRDLLAEALAAIGLEVDPPQATPYFWVPRPGGTRLGVVHGARARAGRRRGLAGAVLRPERRGVRAALADRAGRSARGGGGADRVLAAERHNPGVTTRQPDPAPGAEPERGFVLAAPPKGVDPFLARAARARAHGGRRAGGRARPAPRAARPAHLRRQGQARGAEGDVQALGRRVADRRRRALAGAAEAARGRAAGARGRPDAADPRHLRPARRQRRGQAPGRAGPARVQPPAHARPVAAPRAPRRRRGDEGAGREPARDRPPARATARDSPAAAAEAAGEAAVDAGARRGGARRRRRSRSPATRTSASRRC